VDARFEQFLHGDIRQLTSFYGLHPKTRNCVPRLHSRPGPVAWISGSGRFCEHKFQLAVTSRQNNPMFTDY
jgi:hypothetical protein